MIVQQITKSNLLIRIYDEYHAFLSGKSANVLRTVDNDTASIIYRFSVVRHNLCEADYQDSKMAVFEYPFSSIQRAIGNIDPERDNEIIIRRGVKHCPCTLALCLLLIRKTMNKKINIRIRGLGIPIVALLILLSTSVLQANLHRVALDGSQAYTSILAAINATAHGDTVLVYPGTYIENVNYNGKNITLASLELTTGEEAYRHTTIIDGNHNGSTVLSILPTTNAALYGFTIVNGSGNETMLTGINYSRGGGVCISEMQSFRLSNCVIRNNEALCGGGLTVYNGLLYLRNCTITDNYASHGGGIYIAYFGTVIFDQEQRSDVYSNTSASTQDILAANPQVDLSIYLGTATLNPSSDFYIYYAKTNPNDGMGNLLELDIQDGIRTEINQDFYVSPFGSDENDGLSSQSPLKSIHLAMQRVASDSLNPKTIHLASGTYSSEEGHFYPLGENLLSPCLVILKMCRSWKTAGIHSL